MEGKTDEKEKGKYLTIFLLGEEKSDYNLMERYLEATLNHP